MTPLQSLGLALAVAGLLDAVICFLDELLQPSDDRAEYLAQDPRLEGLCRFGEGAFTNFHADRSAK